MTQILRYQGSMPNRAMTLSQIKRQIATPRRDNRPSAASRGYGTRWRKARKMFLNKHPLCQCIECVGQGLIRAATVVDHIIPHKGNQALFWDQGNWQAMAKKCHDKKTASEDGGFGHKIKEINHE